MSNERPPYYLLYVLDLLLMNDFLLLLSSYIDYASFDPKDSYTQNDQKLHIRVYISQCCHNTNIVNISTRPMAE